MKLTQSFHYSHSISSLMSLAEIRQSALLIAFEREDLLVVLMVFFIESFFTLGCIFETCPPSPWAFANFLSQCLHGCSLVGFTTPKSTTSVPNLPLTVSSMSLTAIFQCSRRSSMVERLSLTHSSIMKVFSISESSMLWQSEVRMTPGPTSMYLYGGGSEETLVMWKICGDLDCIWVKITLNLWMLLVRVFFLWLLA